MSSIAVHSQPPYPQTPPCHTGGDPRDHKLPRRDSPVRHSIVSPLRKGQTCTPVRVAESERILRDLPVYRGRARSRYRMTATGRVQLNVYTVNEITFLADRECAACFALRGPMRGWATSDLAGQGIYASADWRERIPLSGSLRHSDRRLPDLRASVQDSSCKRPVTSSAAAGAPRTSIPSTAISSTSGGCSTWARRGAVRPFSFRDAALPGQPGLLAPFRAAGRDHPLGRPRSFDAVWLTRRTSARKPGRCRCSRRIRGRGPRERDVSKAVQSSDRSDAAQRALGDSRYRV